MTPFVIDKNSWHYRMMNKCNSDSLWRCHDICAYVRAVMLTIVLLAFITTTVGGFIALTVGDTIAWIAACISLGAFVEFGIGPGIILVLTILITCLVGCYQFDEWRKRRSYADPGAVKLAYMSWKDKYCAKITFDYVQKQ